MCTVTFIPVKDKIYITSNRDEKVVRKQALPPAEYSCKGSKLIFPKDADAGGTWIALHESGNAAVLLNGAFQKHKPNPPYLRSRGTVMVDIIAETSPARYFTKTNLQGIEPFTLIIWDDNSLYECRWDGEAKHIRQLRKYRPHIWSSATLYDEETQKRREYWLAKFLNKNRHPNQVDILNFHATGGDGDNSNDLKMNCHGMYSTVSITSIELDDACGSITYHDCIDNSNHKQNIDFISSLFVPQNSFV